MKYLDLEELCDIISIMLLLNMQPLFGKAHQYEWVKNRIYRKWDLSADLRCSQQRIDVLVSTGIYYQL